VGYRVDPEKITGKAAPKSPILPRFRVRNPEDLWGSLGTQIAGGDSLGGKMHTNFETTDLLVFSNLRWDFVFQRPQHILTRQAKYRRVFYFEEAVFGMTDAPKLHLKETLDGVKVIVPYLPSNLKPDMITATLKDLVDHLIFEENLVVYTFWYYSPAALEFTDHLSPTTVIYDRTSECPPGEANLMEKADLVFTAGPDLYESRKNSHPNIHSFPTCTDYAHFSQSRLKLVEPDDQAQIPRPRIGYHGIVDQRFDGELVSQLAEKRPDYHFVIMGPTNNIDPESLPKANNIYYLGAKDHHTLPLYIAGWDCGMMPYNVSEKTRLINPAALAEILTAGVPVVSTPVPEVVDPFEKNALANIASSAEDFLLCIEKAMNERNSDPEWLEKVDWFLAEHSWDITIARMAELECETLKRKTLELNAQIVRKAVLNSARGIL
jgi:UDP-galactopyranose mutase